MPDIYKGQTYHWSSRPRISLIMRPATTGLGTALCMLALTGAFTSQVICICNMCNSNTDFLPMTISAVWSFCSQYMMNISSIAHSAAGGDLSFCNDELYKLTCRISFCLTTSYHSNTQVCIMLWFLLPRDQFSIISPYVVRQQSISRMYNHHHLCNALCNMPWECMNFTLWKQLSI